jgi:hypothetical protein
MGDYKHWVFVKLHQHLYYFLRHDGDHLEDIIDQCDFYSQTLTVVPDTEFYDAHQTEQEIQPKPAAPEDQPAYIPKAILNHDLDYKQLCPFGWIAQDF